jgi:hypothetical protein
MQPLLNWSNAFAGANYDNQRQFGQPLTDLNLQNWSYAMPGVASTLRSGYDAANPGLVNYTAGMQGVMDNLNQAAPRGIDASGYFAATASPTLAPQTSLAATSAAGFQGAGPAAQGTYNPAQAYTAAVQAAQAQTARTQQANGGALFNPLQQTALANLNTLSPLQQQQQQIAGGLLGAGGDLTAQDLRQVQQDTRGAFAARGLYDSNQAIGAEILNSDAARRQRLTQNMGIAAGVDAAGQQQIGANRNFALGVQGQGQNLSQYNTGQANAGEQFNAGLLTQNSQYNAGQQNSANQFNAGLLTQNSQFNAGRAADMSLANAGAQNQMGQWNAGQANANSQFNAAQANAGAQYNAGQSNAMGQFGANLGQNNNQFNAGVTNDQFRYNASSTQDVLKFNANLGAQNANDAWARAMQYGGLQLSQAQDPSGMAASLMGKTPDYSSQLLGYGQDYYNTNLNSTEAASISGANNDASKKSSMIAGGATIAGAAIIAL